MRFIHVGVGGFGRVWVNLLHNTPWAEVVALVDVNEEALAAAREVGGYSADICHSSLAAALAATDADVLVCTTPPRFHRADVVAALEAGLHVISEKPMADTLEDCIAMVRAARDTGRTYAVSQQYRYSPAMWTLAQTLRDSDLGAVGQVKMDFFKGHNFGGGFRHEMPYPLIIDMSIHHFDLTRFLTGLDAVRVTASSWNPPWSNYAGDCSSTVLLEMDNGARLLYNGSWCAKGTWCDWNGNWQIECERGTVTYANGEIRRLAVPELYAVTSDEVIPHVEPELQGQSHVLHDFRDAIAAGHKPKTDCTDNLRSVAMVFATVEAMKTGHTIDILTPEIRELL